MPDTSPLLNRHQLAEALQIRLAGVDALVHREKPIPHYRAGRKFLFSLPEVLEALRVVGEESRS